MTGRERVLLFGVLVLLGAGWGFTQPLTKIAVSTGYLHFGLLFWQMAIGAVVMGAIAWLRGTPLPRGRAQWRTCLIIAMIGSVIPNTASYQAFVHLPSGVLGILLSAVPIWAFPIALTLGLDRFEWRRFAGLLIGLSAVLLLVVPSAELRAALPVIWIGVGLISGLCYAFEGNYVAKWGTSGLDPGQVLLGASIVGTCIALPLALASGQWISPLRSYGAPELAHVGSSVLHVFAYVGYVWIVGRAGPVFAVQVSYMVTLFGILWARLVLGESYPGLVWLALGLMLAGMALVQPRRRPVSEAAKEQADAPD